MTSSSFHRSIGADVIALEAKALLALSESLPESFDAAVELVLSTQTYVVVVGVGKSGHIGRKIAASFASTGTPSFYMHPTEASHGDLGMISPGCSILAISNSGESAELRDVTRFAASLDVPILAITAKANSTLGRAATVALVIPTAAEACPNGLAPTTSTTCTLAMGDALVVAAMTARGFSLDDFGRRHPAGRLGSGLRTVREYLEEQSEKTPFVHMDASMTETILEITSGAKGCVAVVDSDGQFAGMITDGDLRRAMGPNMMTLTAANIMTADPLTLSPDMRMRDVTQLFATRRIGNAFVVEHGTIMGQIDLKMMVAQGYV